MRPDGPQWTTGDLRTEVRRALASVLGDELAAVADDAELREALGDRYDSLAAMECITAIETRFDMEVDVVSDDVRHWFSSIDRITRFVADRQEDARVLGGAR